MLGEPWVNGFDIASGGVHLLRWILAWGDADVAKIMTEAKAEDEIQASNVL